MWHSIIPISSPSFNPVVVEGKVPVQTIIFNAGPSSVRAMVWEAWSKESRENSPKPDFSMELRPGNQALVTGSFIRISIMISDKTGDTLTPSFAAVGCRFIPYIIEE